MDKFRDNKIYELKHSKETLDLVLETIKNYPAPIKESDLVIKTGLSVYNVKDALEYLMEKHDCQLSLDKQNNLLYEFDLQIDQKLTFKSVFKSIGLFFKKAIKFTFKSWITVMVGGYFMVYFPLVLKTLLSSPTLMIWGLPLLITVISLLVIFYPSDSLTKKIARLLKLRKPEKSKKSASKLKGFFSGERLFFTEKTKFNWNILKTTFSYVFGDNQYAIDKLDLERKIVNYINDNNNKITVVELVAITGWSITKAEKEITKIMVHYHGKVSVSEEGTIIYHFPELQSNLIDKKKHTPFVWQNLIKAKPWNRNFTFENNLISFLALLVFSVTGILSVLGQNIPFETIHPWLGVFNFHLIPFSFSSVLFLTFLINKQRYENMTHTKIEEHNHYFQFLKKVFKSPEGILFQKENNIINKAVTELHGDIYTDKEGNTYCRFPEISRELRSVESDSVINLKQSVEKTDEQELSPEWEFDSDFPDGKRSYIGEEIVMVEGDQKISFYMKLYNRFMGLKLFGYSLLSLIPILFMDWLISLGTTGGVISGVFLFMTISGFLFQLSSKLNTRVLKLEEGKVTLKQLPFQLFQKSKVMPFENAESLIIGKKNNTYKLSIKEAGKVSPITLIKDIKDRKILEDISSKLHKLIFRK